MRRTADREIIETGTVLPVRTRSQFVENQEYIYSPLSQYRVAMEAPDFLSKVTSVSLEVENFISNFTNDPEWVFTYVDFYKKKLRN